MSKAATAAAGERFPLGELLVYTRSLVQAMPTSKVTFVVPNTPKWYDKGGELQRLPHNTGPRSMELMIFVIDRFSNE